MTGKQFFDWQTSGGTDDVMRLVDCLERADVPWCCIGGVAVNHWAEQPMVPRDVDLVITLDAVERVVRMLQEAGFTSERFDWSEQAGEGLHRHCQARRAAPLAVVEPHARAAAARDAANRLNGNGKGFCDGSPIDPALRVEKTAGTAMRAIASVDRPLPKTSFRGYDLTGMM